MSMYIDVGNQGFYVEKVRNTYGTQKLKKKPVILGLNWK